MTETPDEVKQQLDQFRADFERPAARGRAR